MPAQPSPLRPVDWQAEGVGPFMDSLNQYYLHTAGNATPAKLSKLLTMLDKLHSEAWAAANRVSMGYARPQWNVEHKRFAERLEAYRETVNRLAKIDPHVPSQELAETVVGPLLMGWYPGEETRRAPDAATPVIMGRQATVAGAAMDDALNKLGRDLLEPFKDAGSLGKAWILGAILGAAAMHLSMRD